MTYPDGEVVSTSYDDQGLPKRLHSDTYSVDYASDVSYNALGQITSLPLGNQLSTSYTYDSLNARLTRIQTGSGGSLLDLEYTYDDVGNVTRIDDKGTTHFTYDALDRLTRAWTQGSDPATYDRSYAYDAIGNVTSKAGESYTYGDAGHVHAVTSVGSSGSYTYDANGNTITRVEGLVTYQQVFNIENRLVSVTASGQTTTSVYDGDGVRTKRTASGGTTVYVGQYYEVQGSTIKRYYYMGGQRIALKEGSAVYYLHADHLGSASS